MPALDGLRILDMTQYEAGPSCTQSLAWLGADVVKIEATNYGDPGRVLQGDGSGYAPYFCNWNANKRSVSLDLRKPEGRDLLLRLLPRFDVFVENYGPGAVDRLKLAYEDLRPVHPRLIYAQVKGFGLSGPYSDYKSYDAVAQAAAGAFSVTGEPDGPPVRPGFTVGDSGTGTQLATAILAAVIQRDRTGEGQHIELSMQEAITYYMRTVMSFDSQWGTQASARTGNSMGAPPIGLYPCKPGGPNDWVFMMTVTGRHWDAFCLALERQDLVVDPRFETDVARVENADALYEEISNWTQARSKHEVMAILGAAGVPCSATLDTKDLHEDPHLVARGFVQKVDLPQHGPVRMLGFPTRMSASDVPIRPAPLLGEHTDQVLGEELSLSGDEVAALRESGVVR